MKIYIKSLMLVVGMMAAQGYAGAPNVDQDDNNSQQQGGQQTGVQQVDGEVACTQEAKQLCISYGQKRYQWVSVGRVGPNCEFPTLPFESEAKYCKGTLAPVDPIVCTLDARVACVQATANKSYHIVELGRVGPNCHFPILQSEVDEQYCADQMQPALGEGAEQEGSQQEGSQQQGGAQQGIQQQAQGQQVSVD